MIIKGLQKLTLLDYPGKVAATVFLMGCNFRCPFCHNASLVVKRQGDDNEITNKDFFDFLKKRHGILDGVCVTGGEPLINPDIEDFIGKIKDLGFLVKLDTNGSFPDRLNNLIDAKLVDYVAMDFKNCYQSYAQTAGKEDFDVEPIKKSVSILLNDKVDYEFRTTVVRELFSPVNFEKIGEQLKGAKRYFLQQYIDSGDILGGGFTSPDKALLNTYAGIVSKWVKKVEIRGV